MSVVEDASAKIITAPWTIEQVDTLNHYQRTEFVHPYKCPMHDGGDHILVATRKGWICPHCAFTQDWASELMLETLVDPREELAKIAPEDLITPLSAVVCDERYSNEYLGLVVRANWNVIATALAQTAAGVYAIDQVEMDRLVGAAHGGAMLFGDSTNACLRIEGMLAEIVNRRKRG
jgi:hypothetical protein